MLMARTMPVWSFSTPCSTRNTNPRRPVHPDAAFACRNRPRGFFRHHEGAATRRPLSLFSSAFIPCACPSCCGFGRTRAARPPPPEARWARRRCRPAPPCETRAARARRLPVPGRTFLPWPQWWSELSRVIRSGWACQPRYGQVRPTARAGREQRELCPSPKRQMM